jgi:predicted glycosyltransferase involved in capsule biosynthesis
MDELITTLLSNKIDYHFIKENAVFRIYDNFTADINFIIPVKNRVSFNKPLYKSFLEARANSDLKIVFTMVEVSDINEHQSFCEENLINYVWVKTDDPFFNKCTAINVGALFTVKSNAFIFHDIDCLIQSDFFVKLHENIITKNAEAVQCFHGRRVLYLDEYLTNLIIDEEIKVDDFHLGYQGIWLPPNIGAPGGSIYVTSNLFFEVGGFDGEFFQANAPEDAFFWDKVDTINKMYVADEPEIDIFHMNHPLTHNSNPFIINMLKIFNTFNTSDYNQKLRYIKLKSELINEYRN